MKKLLSIILLFACGLSFSQSKIRKADKLFNEHNFLEALVIYEDYIQKNPKAEEDKELLLRIGTAYYNINEHRKAVNYFQKAYAKSDIQQPYLSSYVRILRAIREYDKSDEIHLKDLKTEGDRIEIEKFEKDIESFKELLNSEEESRFTIVNLEANSDKSDFGAVFFNDKVVFSSAREDM